MNYRPEYVLHNGIIHPKQTNAFSRSLDAAKAGSYYAGHAGAGGLQQHSVGGLYPFAVVGFGSDNVQGYTYSVQNLVTGELLRARFEDYDAAAAWAELFKAGESMSEVDPHLGDRVFAHFSDGGWAC